MLTVRRRRPPAPASAAGAPAALPPSTPWSATTTSDHLDIDTVVGRWSACNGPLPVPLKVGAHLRSWVFRRIALLSSTGTRALRSMSSP